MNDHVALLLQVAVKRSNQNVFSSRLKQTRQQPIARKAAWIS